MRPKKRPAASVEAASTTADRRRRELIEAAYAVIAEKGLEGLRTREIAARAGVNIATLHYYFGTKEGLLIALVQHLRDRFASDAPGSSVLPTIEAELTDAFRAFAAQPALSAALQELALRATRDAASRDAFREVFAGWNGRVEMIVRAGMEQGALRADLDAAASAAVITSFTIGAMTQLGLSPRGFRFEEVSAQLVRWMSAETATRSARPARASRRPQIRSSRASPRRSR